MFDSALDHPGLRAFVSPEEWRNQRLLDLQAELDRTREELEVFRKTAAQVLTAILAELHTRTTPVGTAMEIQKLADLAEPASAEPYAEPITSEVESIDLGNRESLAYLDRRFRWLPSHRRSGN